MQFYLPLVINAKDNSFSPKRFDNLDIKLDGHLDEEIWQQSQSIAHWYRLTPDEGAPPSEKTTMWLAYDNEAIYLAAALKESNLSAIMTRSLERDSYSTNRMEFVF